MNIKQLGMVIELLESAYGDDQYRLLKSCGYTIDDYEEIITILGEKYLVLLNHLERN
jgi:hypothetical protein